MEHSSTLHLTRPPGRPASKDAAVSEGSEHDRSRVIPISVLTLIPDSVPGVSLYLPSASAHEDYRLYRGPDFPVTADDIRNLKERGTTRLYVACDEHTRYQEYLRSNLDQFLAMESVPVVQRAGMLNEVVRDVLGETFRTGDLDRQMHHLTELGASTVTLICRDDVVLHQMRNVLYHDYHTFTHSANVAMYGAMLARALGISNRDELKAIAVGALLHDAGKLQIPAALLTKPAELTEKEVATVREHPRLGFQMLCQRPDLSFGQLMMIYQHHEKIDGSGYPVRAVGSELHEWGRICAVADVFEALTSNRPYRLGMSFGKATEIMQLHPGTAFDEDMLSCWIGLISRT